MHSLFVAIPIPNEIKKIIERLCYGLPNAELTDPANMYLALVHFGSVDGATLLDIQEKLKSLKNGPFTIKLSTLGCSRNLLWINIEPSEALVKLKKTIESLIEDLPLESDRKPFIPQIPLARFEKIDPVKLADYLSANTDFVSFPFFVETLILVESQMTQRQRKISIEHAKFSL
jgi:2'-5' RNA ligase